jgi:L-ascorbate metabolism protein UlaG (beta-lactamase superfamily)
MSRMGVRVFLVVGLALAVPVCAPRDRPSAAVLAQRDAAAPEIRYVANAGVLVRVEGATLLVDAAFRDGIAPYAVSTPEERARIEGAREPFADVDAILVTHWHEDHFDAAAVAAHLASNGRAVLISSAEVVDRVRRAAPALLDARFRSIVPLPGQAELTHVGRVPVYVIRARHNPARRFPDEHLAFLVGERTPVLHVGDSDPKADTFAALSSLPAVDVAILPFWYLTSPSSRAMVASTIRPRRTIAVHLPPGDASEVGQALRDAGVTTSLPTKVGRVDGPR